MQTTYCESPLVTRPRVCVVVVVVAEVEACASTVATVVAMPVLHACTRSLGGSQARPRRHRRRTRLNHYGIGLGGRLHGWRAVPLCRASQ